MLINREHMDVALRLIVSIIREHSVFQHNVSEICSNIFVNMAYASVPSVEDPVFVVIRAQLGRSILIKPATLHH